MSGARSSNAVCARGVPGVWAGKLLACRSMTQSLDRELEELLELGDRIVSMARDRGGRDLIAECVLRSGAELSAKVRQGQPELVEEAGTRSAGLRVIQRKRVASTSTSDLTDAGIERFVADAVELVGLSQEDPFAGPADPKLLCDPSKAPGLDLFLTQRGVPSMRLGRSPWRRPERKPLSLTTSGSPIARAQPSGGRRVARRLSYRVGFGRATQVRISRSAWFPSLRIREERTGAGFIGQRAVISPSSMRRRTSAVKPRPSHAGKARCPHRAHVRGGRGVRSGCGALDSRDAGRLRHGKCDLA